MIITNPKVLKAKGTLFLVLGLLSAGLLLLYALSLVIFVLLIISIWAFYRFYYFAFYVLHHYADPNYQYAGLISVFRYLVSKKRGESSKSD